MGQVVTVFIQTLVVSRVLNTCSSFLLTVEVKPREVFVVGTSVSSKPVSNSVASSKPVSIYVRLKLACNSFRFNACLQFSIGMDWGRVIIRVGLK